MDERQERLGRNEVLFRELNERIEGVNRFLDDAATDASFVCECGHGECMERIRMTLAEYERVRSDPTLFFAVAGHEEPEVEHVVEEHGGWNVIRKDPGGPAELASAHDPRGK